MNRKQIIRQLRANKITFDANASTAELQKLLPVQNRITKSFNFAKGHGKIEVVFNSSNDDEPAEIMICDEIGKDPWSGEGISCKDIQNALNEVMPKSRPLNFLTNSPGGSVSEGTAIRNILQNWNGRITNTIIGIAASAASWCIPADEVRAYKSSQMFLHKSWGMVVGNSDDMRSAINFLETTDGQIAQMLADQSDSDAAEMMDLMSKETLLTGEQAKDLGLVDTLIDGNAKNTFTAEMLNSMKQKLAALNSLRSAPGTPGQGERKANNQQPTENMKQKLALLNKRGITIPTADLENEAAVDKLISDSNLARNFNVSILNDWKVTFDADNSTDAQLSALVRNGKPAAAPKAGAPTMEDLQNQITRLTEADNAAKNLRIVNRVEQLVKDDKLPANLKDKLVARAKNDETVLDEYEALPSKPPGVEPINALPSETEIVTEAFDSIQKFVMDNGPKFRAQFFGPANAAKLSNYSEEQKKKILSEMGTRAKNVAKVLSDPKNKAKIVSAWNATTIDPGLQRQVILQEFVEEYEIQLLPLKAFATLFSDVVLEGTDEVDVAFYELDGNASTSWNPATGYAAAGNQTVETRKVYIGGSGVTSGAAATVGFCKDRLFQQLQYSSYEQTRQPYVNWQKLTSQKANKLGVDVFQQFVSRVLTRANFGAPSKILPAAQFTADDIADLAEVATGLNWPVAMRMLVLNHTYRTPLLKDPTFKYALNYGSSDPIRKGIVADAYGFSEIPIVPNLTNYSPAGENLVGWINHISAALFATAPIMPTEEVRALMTRFDIAISPQLGANICYRRFGNAVLDQTNEIVECSFGGGKGVQNAMRLFASA